MAKLGRGTDIVESHCKRVCVIHKTAKLSGKASDPAATDLDYYSKPENYEGSTLQSLRKFNRDKNKEAREKQAVVKKKTVKDAKYHFFNRYKHILKDAIFLDELLEREREADSDDERESELRGGEGRDEALARKDSRKSATSPLLIAIKEEGAEGADKTDKLELKSHMSARSMEFDAMDNRTGSPDSSGTLTPGGSSRKRLSVMPMSPGSGRQSVAIQRAQMDKMSREIRMAEIRESFVRAVKCVKAICRLSASARGKQPGGDMSSMRTFMDIANDETNTEENMKNAGLSFDPTFFKAKKEISLSTDTKNILTTPSELRTPEQVQTAMFGLQTLRSYAEYPLHMQEKLAKVAWYEIVAPKRIIIRQGHFAENFYFILSGNAVVTILLKDPKTGSSFVKTATVMKKGMSFGELALLHHSKRTATVTSQDTVQLLSIGREDFFDIFMASDGPDGMPHHIKFVSNLEFMKEWPIDMLVENPQHCLLHFFKRNTTIAANSNASDWIYIVKSGSCQVLKKLKGVIPNCQFYSKASLDDDSFSSVAKTKATIFAPKVDTGLRKRKKSSDTEEENEAEPVDSCDEAERETKQDVKFSKDHYSRNPTTRPAHFVRECAESSFDRRKHYDPPQKCKPKKVEVVKEAPAPSKPGPVFVQVSTLKPRDVFGLDSVQFDDDIKRLHTSVTLVSRGAECVMLSKEFFVRHATEKVKKFIRESVRPYPDEEVFQGNLQIKEDWRLYKKVLITDLTSRIIESSNRFNS